MSLQMSILKHTITTKAFIIHLKDPVKLSVEEKMEVALNFEQPGSGGPYEEITWYKNGTGGSQYRIVLFNPHIVGEEPLYYNEFCSGSSPCETSSKGELNVDAGELTIYSVTISDEGFYYYFFYVASGTADTGHKYEIDMEVYGNSIITVLKAIPNICTILLDPRNFKIPIMSINTLILMRSFQFCQSKRI